MSMKTGMGLGAAVLLLAACSGPKGPFREIRAWEFKEMQTAMVFCAAAEGQDEAVVRREAERVARDRQADFRRVDVVILYDAARAREVSSNQAMENMMKGAGTPPAALLYGGVIEGGGFLSAVQDEPAARWTFVPRRDTRESAKDKGFSK